jgi:hypothetical protein
MASKDFEKTCHLELAPEVDILQNGRRRVTRRFELGKNGNIDDVIYAAYGDADPAEITACTTGYANLKLVAQKVQPRQPNQASLLVQVFETLTNVFVAEVDDATDYEMNGLKRVTRTLIALPSTSTAAFVVGTQTYGAAPTLYLAKALIEDNDAYVRVKAEYLQAGVLSKSKSSGPSGLPGTTTHTWETWKSVPTALSPALPGLVTSIEETNISGYPTLRYSSVANSSGSSPVNTTLSSFQTLVPVNNPGEIYVTRIAQGTGFIPYMDTKPPTKGLVQAAVTVKLQAAAPTPAKPTAYNLDGLYVSVLQISRTVAYLGSKSTDSGGITVSLYSDLTNVKQDPVSGYIYKAPPSGTDYNGSTQSYTSPAGLEKSAGGSIITTIDNTYYATITLTGSSAYPTPASGELIAVDVDPITIDTAGTVVYRVTEYKVP